MIGAALWDRGRENGATEMLYHRTGVENWDTKLAILTPLKEWAHHTTQVVNTEFNANHLTTNIKVRASGRSAAEDTATANG